MPTLIATGPLTADKLAAELATACGRERLAFYDAIAPIVEADSVLVADTADAPAGAAFFLSRWGKGEGTDYLNCPLDRAQYEAFVAALLQADRAREERFEDLHYFEGCLPIEVMADRGDEVLAFGPLKPVGLVDPRPGALHPHAVVQLRAENRYGTAYNLVGFQTRLTYLEQKRIFALIPALAHAEFLRFGSIHRNAYLHSPSLLDEELRLRENPDLRFAGQITGVEGYIESTAIGLLVAAFVADRLAGRATRRPPEETALGGLYQHLTRPRAPGEPFQPTNINFGLLPPLGERARKRERRALHGQRARIALEQWLAH